MFRTVFLSASSSPSPPNPLVFSLQWHYQWQILCNDTRQYAVIRSIPTPVTMYITCICNYQMAIMLAHSFIHSAVCLTTCPQPLPQTVLHTVRASASSFNLQYPLVSLRSPSSCSRLLLLLRVT
jgi:hypothetical protein